jgi:hypothetical protein
MKHKMMLLGLSAVVAAAFAALPAVASAGTPTVTCAGAACGAFTSHGNTVSALSTESGTTVTCTSNSGTGNYTSTTTGTIQLTFHGCKTPTFFNTACTTPGQTSGTIKTGVSVFHNIYIEPNKTTPGVLITQPAGAPYTTFNCAGFLHVEVTGSIIGHLESPACGGSSNVHKLNFVATAHGQQQFKQITTSGTAFDLTSHVFGSPTTSAMNGTGNVTFAAGKSGTVNCV